MPILAFRARLRVPILACFVVAMLLPFWLLGPECDYNWYPIACEFSYLCVSGLLDFQLFASLAITAS